MSQVVIDSDLLRRLIDQTFNEEELKNLAQILQVDYDNLPAAGKVNKARELINYCTRRHQTEHLLRALREERPSINWDDALLGTFAAVPDGGTLARQRWTGLRGRLWGAGVLLIIVLFAVWMIVRPRANWDDAVLEEYTPTSINLRHYELYDITAGNNEAWLATHQGLLHYEGGNLRAIPSTSSYHILSVTGDLNSRSVWFGMDNGRIGHYNPEINVTTLFTPTVPHAGILDLVLASDGAIWAGDKHHGLLRYYPVANRWEAIAAPALLKPTPSRIDRISLNPADRRSLMVISSGFAYQWDQGEWRVFTPDNSNNLLPESAVQAVIVDDRQRIWFGTQSGLVLYVPEESAASAHTWTSCHSTSFPFAIGGILDLALAPDSKSIWILGEKGLANLAIDAETMPDNCTNWKWKEWPATNIQTGFWQENSESRLGISPDTNLSHIPLIWLLKRYPGDSRILYLVVR